MNAGEKCVNVVFECMNADKTVKTQVKTGRHSNNIHTLMKISDKKTCQVSGT